jgi:hypothetical protein
MSRRKILEDEYSSRNKEPFSKFSNGSRKKVWWKCPKSECNHPHEWEAIIYSRTKDNGSGCPFCSGRNICPCNSLQTLKPDISVEWHPRNNLKPSEVSVSSHKKVWWKCPKSGCGHPHEWEATINNRTNDRGCPFCAGKKICPCNSLQTLKPDIVSEWHPRNTMKPSEVSVGSNKKVWWKCLKMDCDHHEWESIINSRTSGNGCPFCYGLKVCPCNSLQTLNPDIAAQWHPKKNNSLKPSEVSVSSNKKVWWKCPKSECDHPHEWETTINDRTRDNGTGCPFCSGRKVCPCNSLQTLKPDISAQWHPKKNNSLKPSEVSVGSPKKVWWKCPKSECNHPHEWKTTVNSRTNGCGCPFCSGRKVCPCNSLQTLKPDISEQWHPKNTLKPSEVSVSSGEKVRWKCLKKGCDHHIWEATIAHRTNGRGCPFCAGKKVCPCNSLQTLKPDIASEWHPRNTMKPSEVSVGSGEKVWWKCLKMGCDHHEWEVKVNNRTHGYGCPFCAGQKVCPCNSLQTLKPDIAATWHPQKNNLLKPSEVSVGSPKKVWWKCPKSECNHPHEWKTTIASRSNGCGCPFCSGRRICPCNSLQTLKPDISAEWHPKNTLKPSEVSVSSGKKVWWKCLKKGCDHHEWKTTIAHRTNGRGCPFCRTSKGEDKIVKILENRKIKYIYQKKLNYKGFSFDFFLPDSNTAIEFDGLQHFEPVEFFGGEESFLKQRENDLLKNIYCSNNGINLLRIHYEDIEEIEFYLEVVFIPKPFGENIYILLSTNYM